MLQLQCHVVSRQTAVAMKLAVMTSYARLSEVLQSKRSEDHSCHYRGSAGEPRQFLSQIVPVVGLGIDSCFFVRLKNSSHKDCFRRSHRGQSRYDLPGHALLCMSHLLYKRIVRQEPSLMSPTRSVKKLTYSETLRNELHSFFHFIFLFIEAVQFRMSTITVCFRLPISN